MDPINRDSTKVITDSGDNGAIKRVGDRAHGVLDGLSHAAGDLAAKARHGVADAASTVQDSATWARRSSRQLVREHPIGTMAAAVGAGIVIGVLLARSLFQRG